VTAAPRTEHQRAEILDVMRGFALVGIFLAHVPGFSGWDYLSPAEHTALDGTFDITLQFIRNLLIRDKFFSLFSLLFGFGFALQLASATRSGDDFIPRFRRRQLGLLVIGVLHSALWSGDILLKYALLGLLLMPTASWTTEKLFRLAVGCLMARGLWAFIPWISMDLMNSIATATLRIGQDGVDTTATLNATVAGYYSDSWRETLSSNLNFLQIKWLNVLYEGRLLSIVGFFALGASLGRWRIHERTVELRNTLWRVFVVGGAVGLLGNTVLAVSWETVPVFPPSGSRVLEGAIMAIAVPALTLAMASGLALAWDGGGRRGLIWLAAPGRMALTVYLTQTAIGIGVFYGIGLGWRGSFSLASCFVFAGLAFVIQTVAAGVWLRHFTFGPVEWLWRSVTYGRRLPLLRTSHS
jgi:uncharacterized protein